MAHSALALATPLFTVLAGTTCSCVAHSTSGHAQRYAAKLRTGFLTCVGTCVDTWWWCSTPRFSMLFVIGPTIPTTSPALPPVLSHTPPSRGPTRATRSREMLAGSCRGAAPPAACSGSVAAPVMMQRISSRALGALPAVAGQLTTAWGARAGGSSVWWWAPPTQSWPRLAADYAVPSASPAQCSCNNAPLVGTPVVSPNHCAERRGPSFGAPDAQALCLGINVYLGRLAAQASTHTCPRSVPAELLLAWRGTSPALHRRHGSSRQVGTASADGGGGASVTQLQTQP